jgi:hypothetical protein
MAIRKKGSRPLVVDGVRYRWRVRHRPTYLQGAFAHRLTVGVEAEGGSCSLLVELSQAHPSNWIGDPAVPVTPREVADAIRAALAVGWQPMEPGSAFRWEVTGIAEPGGTADPRRHTGSGGA